jgi:hypothetical protein
MWNMQLRSAPAIFNLNLQYIIVQTNFKKINIARIKKIVLNGENRKMASILIQAIQQ